MTTPDLRWTWKRDSDCISESTDGSNPVCLNTARENFIKYGKCIYDKAENSGEDKTSIIDFMSGS